MSIVPRRMLIFAIGGAVGVGCRSDDGDTGATGGAASTSQTAASSSTSVDEASSAATTSPGTTSGPSTAGSVDTSSVDGSDESGSTGDPTLPPSFPDLALGPYPSLLTIAVDSMHANADVLDTSTTYAHSAAQGYLLQAIGELLWAARAYDLPQRDALIATALGEVAELEAADDAVLGGGPGFGLDEAWDAFSDGSTNPAFTAYTWQSGMVALGVAKIARVLDHIDHEDAAAVRDYATALVTRWDAHYTANADGGYWWYSTQQADAIAVHNTSALVAMASQIISESGGGAAFAGRPQACADLLWARTTGNPTAGYAWNYADDGYPIALRGAEDVSHALVTLQFMREAAEQAWWTDAQMQGIAQTLLSVVWTGNPARLHGFVDGSAGGDSEWSWTSAAAIGYAAHGDAPGGDPEVFDAARSILFSSYLSRNERAPQGSTVDSARTLAVALLLAHRPSAFSLGSEWEQAAGEGDALAPAAPGGVRFYTVDWAVPADYAAGLTLPARVSTSAAANLVVDLEDSDAGRVIVSLTYAAATNGSVGQWDGVQYRVLAPVPATVHDDGNTRWFRTTFELDTGQYFDYQPGVPGKNILLELSTAGIAVHRIEATRL